MKDAHDNEAFHHGFYEIFLPVTDVSRAIDFYAKLGFWVGRQESPSSALLLYNDNGARSMLGLFLLETIERPAHLSFRVSEMDVDGMVPYLLRLGIEPIHPLVQRFRARCSNRLSTDGCLPLRSSFTIQTATCSNSSPILVTNHGKKSCTAP